MYFIPSHADMKDYFKNLDEDGSGEVDKKEFTAYINDGMKASK